MHLVERLAAWTHLCIFMDSFARGRRRWRGLEIAKVYVPIVLTKNRARKNVLCRILRTYRICSAVQFREMFFGLRNCTSRQMA